MRSQRDSLPFRIRTCSRGNSIQFNSIPNYNRPKRRKKKLAKRARQSGATNSHTYVRTYVRIHENEHIYIYVLFSRDLQSSNEEEAVTSSLAACLCAYSHARSVCETQGSPPITAHGHFCVKGKSEKQYGHRLSTTRPQARP